MKHALATRGLLSPLEIRPRPLTSLSTLSVSQWTLCAIHLVHMGALSRPTVVTLTRAWSHMLGKPESLSKPWPDPLIVPSHRFLRQSVLPPQSVGSILTIDIHRLTLRCETAVILFRDKLGQHLLIENSNIVRFRTFISTTVHAYRHLELPAVLRRTRLQYHSSAPEPPTVNSVTFTYLQTVSE